MSEDDVRRAARLCELTNEHMGNRTPAERDRQMQEWIAQAMTRAQRCAALVSLMNFAIACKQAQAEKASEQSVC